MAKNKCERCEDLKGLVSLYMAPSTFKLLVKKLHLPSLLDEECRNLAADINEMGYGQLSHREITKLDNECREISLRHFKFMETIASSITVIEIQKDREAR